MPGEEKQVFAYCLFCETQRCRLIAEFITRRYGYKCFSPQVIQRKWIKGIPMEERHDWLPGYVFLYTNEEITPRFDISGIIRCLGNGGLIGNDLTFAEMLFHRNGILGQVSLLQEGDHCFVADPSWKGIQGTVIKMDRGRKRCCLEFSFDGIRRTIWVGYELLEPNKDKNF